VTSSSASPAAELREVVLRVRVTKTVRERLEAIAAAEERPLSQIVRRALDAELELHNRTDRRRRGR
jgi:predicted transcriptional regulator